MNLIRAFNRLLAVGTITLFVATSACNSASIATTLTTTATPTLTAVPPKIHRIAFNPFGSIYVINADGTGLVQVVKQGGDPAWSPDGQFIAYGNAYIYAVDANGSEPVFIAKADSGDPLSSKAWSPDGKRIAFSTSNGGEGGAIYTTTLKHTTNGLDGSVSIPLRNGMDADHLSWSPDGQYLAFDYITNVHESARIGVIDSKTGKLTDIVYNARNAVWSPNGEQMLFSRDIADSGNSDIHLISDMAQAIQRYRYDYPSLTNNSAGNGAPDWSPDGKSIVFVSNRDGNWEIYVMDADGSHQTRLTDSPADETQPTWSPDGKQIAFASERDGNWEIYVMDADGSHLLRLTNNKVDDFFPVWQPQPEP